MSVLGTRLALLDHECWITNVGLHNDFLAEAGLESSMGNRLRLPGCGGGTHQDQTEDADPFILGSNRKGFSQTVRKAILLFRVQSNRTPPEAQFSNLLSPAGIVLNYLSSRHSPSIIRYFHTGWANGLSCLSS